MEVENNLKGTIEKNFVFAQEGGLQKERNKIIIFDNYNIFRPGERYLFFLTSYPQEPGKYYSVGSSPTVYLIKDNKAQNTIPGRDKDLSELKQIIEKHKMADKKLIGTPMLLCKSLSSTFNKKYYSFYINKKRCSHGSK